MTESSSPGEKKSENDVAGQSNNIKDSATTNADSEVTKESRGEAPTAPPEIGDKCEVVFREIHRLRAEIIERRPLCSSRNENSKSSILVASENDQTTTNTLKKRKRNTKNGKPVTQKELSEKYPTEKIEYYIHYDNHDRRLDEWVTADRFFWNTLERNPTGGSHHHGGHPAVGASTHTTAPKTGSKVGRRRKSATATTSTLALEISNPDAMPSAAVVAETPTTPRTTGGNWRPTAANGLQELEREHHEITKVKNIDKIYIGGAEVDCWYYSPYPDEYQPSKMLYVCEFTLKYMRKRKTFLKHKSSCPHRTPPGREIYRERGLSVYEIDGKEHRVYCQNLCLLAKLFLDHKTLYYDVDPFYFYIVCSVDDSGAHIVGYFSKEKVSNEGYNLACILTFPQHQQHGYGKFIISLSYELSKREGKVGSPEKPLSDLGKVSYRSYWTHILLNFLAKYDPSRDSTSGGSNRSNTGASNLTIKDISIATAMKQEDIISTLQYLDMIRSWKGQHVVYVQQDIINEYMKKSSSKKMRLCNPEYLEWDPSHYPSPKKAEKK